MASKTKELPKWAENIKRRRLSTGNSLVQIAKRAKIGEETLRRMEAGRPVNLKSIQAVAKTLGVTLSYIFAGC